MSAPRFYVDAELALGAVALPETVAHHALRVLRLRDGAPLVLFNGRGGEYHGQLRAQAPGEARAGQEAVALLTGFDAVERESPLSLTVLQALVASDKLDWIVEKLTELGIARLVIARTERSVVRLDGARTARRLAHWRDIAIAACAQCARNRVPELTLHDSLASAVSSLSAGPRHVLVPDAAVALAATRATACAVAVGPEGGFTTGELALLQTAQFEPARLGPRVLRTETAGMTAVAILQAGGGDLR